MSVENNVFLFSSNIPSPSMWRDAILKAGFEMEMDTDFDMKIFEGFLPCKYQGVDAGFEYYLETLDTEGLSDDELQEINGRDCLITLVTHSDFREYMTSMIAAAVLCSISDGLLAEGGEPPFISSLTAIEWAKECEPSIQKEINKKE